MSGEKPYINIGTEKASLFLNMSKRLINILERNPLLYYSVEESLKCSSQGYYTAGILAYSQLYNVLGLEAPEERHRVAHELLRHRPTKDTYESMLETIKYVTEMAYISEADKFEGSRNEFHRDLYSAWEKVLPTLT